MIKRNVLKMVSMGNDIIKVTLLEKDKTNVIISEGFISKKDLFKK